MMNMLKIFLVPVLGVIVLGACGTKPEEMQRHDSDSMKCKRVSEIVGISSQKGVNRLTITEMQGDTPIHYGIVTWVVQKVTGVVKNASLKIYLKIAINLDFRFLVTMMMTLAVLIFAASVLLGMIQANGYNLLVFVIKLIIIYHLSINYIHFYSYVIQTFEAIVADTMMLSSLTFSDYLSVDPTIICLGLFGQACDVLSIVENMFGFNLGNTLLGWFPEGDLADITKKFFLFNAFDDTISMFFDVRMWKLTLALGGTGMTGFFWALMLLLMNVIYLFAVIAAIKVYLLSYIARWALYGLGPIFISFALFKQTKSLFDGWLQQLISFTLQPVLLFIFLGMFQSIISGLATQIYIDMGNNSEFEMYEICPPGASDCTSIPCQASEPQCDPDTLSMEVHLVTYQAKDMCVKWDKWDNDSNTYWYKLCGAQIGSKDICKNSSKKPMIPIDIWMVMAIIIICYIMFAMCGWVTEVANSLASGAMSISGTKIMGWDAMKQGIKKGGGGIVRSITSGGGANR